MGRLFTGDYSTGDFRQWHAIQNILVPSGSATGAGYATTGYPAAAISEDKDCGYVARYEVRSGDVPPFLTSGERSEVDGDTAASAPLNSTRWYAFSNKFAPDFPLNSADYGWCLTNQWHDAPEPSPVITWGVLAESGKKTPNGYWSLIHNKQGGNGPGNAPTSLGTTRLLDVPLNRGHWIDVKMEIHWSTSDDDGYIRVWIDGVRQTLLTGGQTFTGRTAVPGTGWAGQPWYKEGLYRQKDVAYATQVIYHTGFRMADSENSL